MAAVKARSSPGVENYHVCDRCSVTGSQDIISLISFVVVLGVTHSLREYNATVEQACLSLESYEAEERRAEIQELSNVHAFPGQISSKKRPRYLRN